jgi:hypothetical protein
VEKMSSKKRAAGKFKDFIDFKPDIIKYLSAEQHFTVQKYKPIVAALRKKPLTPKEILELYYNEDSKEYSCSIKSIYRYLEKLEEAELITVAGHRITEGKRVSENLYMRTALVFTKKSINPKHPAAVRKRNMTKESLQVILEELSDLEIKDYEKFNDVIEKLLLLELDYSRAITDKLPKSVRLVDQYKKNDMEFMNYLNDFAARLYILLQHPELIESFRNLFSIK